MRLLRLPEVLARVSMSKSTWYEGVKSGRFPKPIKLSGRHAAWRESDIDEWIAGLPEAGGTWAPAPPTTPKPN